MIFFHDKPLFRLIVEAVINVIMPKPNAHSFTKLIKV